MNWSYKQSTSVMIFRIGEIFPAVWNWSVINNIDLQYYFFVCVYMSKRIAWKILTVKHFLMPDCSLRAVQQQRIKIQSILSFCRHMHHGAMQLWCGCVCLHVCIQLITHKSYILWGMLIIVDIINILSIYYQYIINIIRSSIFQVPGFCLSVWPISMHL